MNKGAGLLGKKQRTWLGEFLPAHSKKPVVIFVHHTLGDDEGDLLDVERLFDVIKPHPQVKAIFYGHSHVWSLGEKNRVKLVNLPAVGYNFADKDPVGWMDAHFDERWVELEMYAFAGNRIDDGRLFRINWI